LIGSAKNKGNEKFVLAFIPKLISSVIKNRNLLAALMIDVVEQEKTY